MDAFSQGGFTALRLWKLVSLYCVIGPVLSEFQLISEV